MRLVAKHAQVGYLQPGARPGCRNCRYGEPYRPEAGCVMISTRWACTKHDLEVTSGGICESHHLKAHADESRLRYLARYTDSLKSMQRELVWPLPDETGEQFESRRSSLAGISPTRGASA